MWLVESWSGMDIAVSVREVRTEVQEGGVACLLPASLGSVLPSVPFLYSTHFLEALGSPRVSQALSSERPGWEAPDPMEGRGRKWTVCGLSELLSLPG